MKQKQLNLDRISNIQILDFSSKETQEELLNTIDLLYKMVIELKEENQRLKDEINRMKGEKGKPDIKANVTKSNNQNNKKMEQGERKNWTKGSKKDKIKIDRIETISLDTSNLPEDVVFKGYEERIVQNIIIKTDNVLYKFEKYYSPSENKTYIAKKEEIKGTEFGAETKALIHTLYFENRVTENKIASFLNANGLIISEGTISNILIQDMQNKLLEEKIDIYNAGLESSTYQQIDDTGMRVDGKNTYATIVCNENYSAFFINPRKNKETVKSIIGEDEKGLFDVLICDDAPQFKDIANIRALCWVHEERHYEKLTPFFEIHKQILESVISQIWDYYNLLKKYKDNPTESQKESLSSKFDEIFGQKTDYENLNKRLALTLAKKEYLLVVLEHPEIPLHNNLSENGVRELVIKRKISGGVKTEAGKKAWENVMTILATCKKLGVSFYEYMKDIFSGSNQMTPLSEIISKK